MFVSSAEDFESVVAQCTLGPVSEMWVSSIGTDLLVLGDPSP